MFKTHLRSLAQLLDHFACGTQMLLRRPNTLKCGTSNQVLESTLLHPLHIPIFVHPEHHHQYHCLRSWAVQWSIKALGPPGNLLLHQEFSSQLGPASSSTGLPKYSNKMWHKRLLVSQQRKYCMQTQTSQMKSPKNVVQDNLARECKAAVRSKKIILYQLSWLQGSLIFKKHQLELLADNLQKSPHRATHPDIQF